MILAEDLPQCHVHLSMAEAVMGLETTRPEKDLLYLVVCAASPARHSGDLVRQLSGLSWRVRLVATVEASSWLDCREIVELTGFTPLVRVSDLDGSRLAVPAVVIVAPATFNTIGKLAAGFMDSLALAVVQEAMGRRTRTLVLPHVNGSLADSHILQRGLGILEDAGVTVLRESSVCDGGCAAGAHTSELVERAGTPGMGDG